MKEKRIGRKIIYFITFVAWVLILSAVVRYFFNFDERLPLLVDAGVFAVAMILTEVLDKSLIKSGMWSGSNEKK